MSLRRTPLSYCKHSISGFSRVRSLGGGFLLDSGHGYPDHIDVYSAAPAVQVALASATAAELDAALSRLCDPLEKYQISGDHSLPMPGWYGVWSYDLGQITESIPLDITNPRLPLMWMGFYPSIVVTDHKAEQTWLLSLTEYEDHARELLGVISSKSKEEQSPFRLIKPFEGNLNAADYASLFQRVQHYIHGGDCYQINLSQCYSAPYTGSVWRAYQRIRASLSAPMGAYFEVDDWALLSVSPERFIRCDKGNVETKPIKGTRPRGLTPEEDQLLLDQLRNSAKDRAENLMIVDLLRNDLGRSCTVGSVKVSKLFEIESFSNVHHLVSTISGQLHSDTRLSRNSFRQRLLLLVNAFPGGSITGAPKHRAMQIIDELEPVNRGFYCGSVVYLDVAGRMDSSILIRSLVAQDNQLQCWGGGGIVADSTCAQEYQEIQDKVGSILKALS